MPLKGSAEAEGAGGRWGLVCFSKAASCLVGQRPLESWGSPEGGGHEETRPRTECGRAPYAPSASARCECVPEGALASDSV